MKQLHMIWPLVTSLGLLSSCSTISTFDQKAYEHATSLKVDTRNLIALADQSYFSHRSEVKSLQTDLEKAYEYDLGRPKNEYTIKQWNKLLNPKGDLVGGFLVEWKASGTLLPAYVQDKQNQIGRCFDTIIGLESGKIKPTDTQ